jgi:hypothetical protein
VTNTARWLQPPVGVEVWDPDPDGLPERQVTRELPRPVPERLAPLRAVALVETHPDLPAATTSAPRRRRRNAVRLCTILRQSPGFGQRHHAQVCRPARPRLAHLAPEGTRPMDEG